jgi:hypothetical protein
MGGVREGSGKHAINTLTHQQSFITGPVLVLPHLLSLLVLLLPLLVTPFRLPIPSSSSSCRPSSSFSPSLLRTYSLADKEETTTSSSSSTQQKRQELEALTVYELRSACKQRGLVVAARLKRTDLVDLLLGDGVVRREGGREGKKRCTFPCREVKN